MQTLMQFKGDASEPHWVVVNDGVMGGESQGDVALCDAQLHFTGALSLANNGGFASIRTHDRDFDFTGVTHVVLKVCGDGRTWQLRLATNARYRDISVSYSASFTTIAGEWRVVRVALDQLVPTARGRQLDGPPFDPERISEIGLLIGDKRAGAFSLALDWIAVE